MIINNLISTECFASFIYKCRCKRPINTPFRWSCMSLENLYNLHNNYKNLDYNNVKFEISNEFFSYNKGFIAANSDYVINKSLNINYDNAQCVKLIIDNLITIYYPHNLYKEDVEYIKTNGNVISNNIIQRNREIYFNTLKRFNVNNNTAFLVTDYCVELLTKDQLEYMDKLNQFDDVFFVISKEKNMPTNITNKQNILKIDTKERGKQRTYEYYYKKAHRFIESIGHTFKF